jgi:hypothetical protein
MSTKFVIPLSRASDAGITELTVAPLAAKQRARLPYALVMKITAREELTDAHVQILDHVFDVAVRSAPRR